MLAVIGADAQPQLDHGVEEFSSHAPTRRCRHQRSCPELIWGIQVVPPVQCGPSPGLRRSQPGRGRHPPRRRP